MSTQFSKGPTFGLSADVRTKLAQKYDSQMEEALRMWIHEVTGRTVPDNFMEGLKDGVILCELINKLQPGSIPKVNYSALNWHKNITHFANDLFEDMNHTQVQCTLITLAGVAKTKGFYTKSDIGVKYAAKKQRKFNPDKMKAWNSIISQQMGSNKFASQKGMTSYGTRRRLYNPNIGMEKHKPPNGQVTEKNVNLDPVDTTTVSLQMGTNKVPSQSGLTPMGGSRLVYDHKYCAKPNEQHGPDFPVLAYLHIFLSLLAYIYIYIYTFFVTISLLLPF
uniref:Calponin n=1 Tax=Sinocyclocheilus anshuiensis TaxID=1608454 RepID=A0A671L9E2_9TELE